MKAFCLIALCFFPLLTQAQPAWQWAKIANDPGESMCNSIATDAAGNAYVVCTFTGTLHLGATTLTSTGDSDIFFAKYDLLGNLVWAKHEGGPGGDQGFGIAVDAQGDVYVAGTFYQSIAFDTFSFSSNGFADLCLAKYDNNGDLIWAKAWGSIYEDLGSNITVDKYNNVFLTGMFADYNGSPPAYGTIDFDTTTLTSHGNGDIFVLKLNSLGIVDWAKGAGGKFSDQGNRIVVDSLDNVYVTGDFTAPKAYFDNIELNAKVGPYQDMFIAKYDSSGNALWAKGAGGDFPNGGIGLGIDNIGNVYVGGSSFQGTYIKFDNNIILNNDKGFIASYSNSGNIAWAKNIGYHANAVVGDLKVDLNANIYVTGFFNNSVAPFGNDTLHGAGSDDIFVTAYNNMGDEEWAKFAGGVSSDGGYAIAIDNSHNILIAGYTSSQPASFDAFQISATSSWDPFVAKLSNPLAVTDVHLSANDIHVYPNPTDDIIYIIADDKVPALIQLIDVTGRIILSQSSATKNSSISIKQVPDGIYYLRLSAKANTVMKKIVVQH